MAYHSKSSLWALPPHLDTRRSSPRYYEPYMGRADAFASEKKLACRSLTFILPASDQVALHRPEVGRVVCGACMRGNWLGGCRIMGASKQHWRRSNLNTAAAQPADGSDGPLICSQGDLHSDVRFRRLTSQRRHILQGSKPSSRDKRMAPEPMVAKDVLSRLDGTSRCMKL